MTFYRPAVHSLTPSQPPVHSPSYLLIHLCVFTQLSINWPTIYPSTNPSVHPPTHTAIYSSTHIFIHSSIYYLYPHHLFIYIHSFTIYSSIHRAIQLSTQSPLFHPSNKLTSLSCICPTWDVERLETVVVMNISLIYLFIYHHLKFKYRWTMS